jgi:rhamnosyltransferase subunit B
MFVGPWRVARWVPQLIRRRLWSLLDRYKLEPMAAPTLNAWRARHGLSAIVGPVFDKWIHSPECIVAMFPRDFCPPPGDWPKQLVQCGFPLFDPGCPAESNADPELARFVSDHTETPLVVLYAGSTPTRQRGPMRRLARDLSLKSVRCLLLGFDMDPNSDSAYILNRSSVHLPDVLAHANLFIHHGGIGAIAQGYASGVTQLGLPSAYDQFDNCERLRSALEIASPTPIVRRSRRIEDCVADLLSNLHTRRQQPSSAGHRYSLPESPNGSVQSIAKIILGEK